MPRLTRYGAPCAYPDATRPGGVCGILRDYHGLAGPRPTHRHTLAEDVAPPEHPIDHRHPGPMRTCATCNPRIAP